MTACERAGCTGTIEDGFCDTCGLAPLPPATAPVGAAVGAPATSAGTGTAAQAGTTGTAARAGTTGTAAQVGTSTGTSATPTGTTGTTGRTGTTGGRRGTGRTARGRLGAGLVEVPRVPYRDPASAVMTNPMVPENRRFCSNCGAEVGRSRNGAPGRIEGFCAKCGHQFSFAPKLAPGELVAGQYEVLGCLAHGGLGWIYLARDHNVSDRWVVLKGLLDSGDADAMAAAVAERGFLAEVEHPNIVKIYNFVQHQDRSGSLVGYIVMEYVGGESLKDMLKKRREESGHTESLPLPQVIAYVLEILPALGYLHSVGLLFCDFKPDNVIQTEEQVKLLDLGAVRRIDDHVSPIWGTTGYQAPEVGRSGTSISSDLYTVGRALAVMSMAFDFRRSLKDRLPDPVDAPLLAQYESFHRFLKRATHHDPARRFQSAEEMAEQLTGVLREVTAAEEGVPKPGLSTQFTPERRHFRQRVTAAELPAVALALPVPQVDPTDPAAAFLAGTSSGDPAELVAALQAAPVVTAEVRLRLVRTRIEQGDLATARRELAELAAGSEADGLPPGDWRVTWYQGLAALAGGDPAAARTAFDAVYDELPGEAAPKLAIAVCAEAAGDTTVAARYYRVVWRTDHAWVSAAFGLARALLAQRDRARAVEVLHAVPDTSSQYQNARIAAIRARVDGLDRGDLTEADLVAASAEVDRLDVDEERRTRLSGELLDAAARWLAAGGTARPTSRVAGRPLTERDVRFGLEGCYRALARLARTAGERIALVDQANAVRPRTLV